MRIRLKDGNVSGGLLSRATPQPERQEDHENRPPHCESSGAARQCIVILRRAALVGDMLVFVLDGERARFPTVDRADLALGRRVEDEQPQVTTFDFPTSLPTRL